MEPLKETIKDNIDITLVSEFKLDETFTASHFCIDGYSTRYTSRRYPFKIIKFEPLDSTFKAFFAEINLMKTKWLLSCSYNTNRINIVDQVKNIRTVVI